MTKENTTHEHLISPQTPQPTTVTNPPVQSENGLAIASMVLGIVSLTGFGLILGIPAIVMAIIAMKKSSVSKGLSITGLVTGIISTVISLLVIAFFGFIFIWAINNPEKVDEMERYDSIYQEQSPYTGSRT